MYVEKKLLSTKGIVALATLLLSLFVAFCAPALAHAQSYKALEFPEMRALSDFSGSEEAFGHYYKCSKSLKLYVSSEENGPWEKTGLNYDAIVGKSQVYGVLNKTLYVYDITKKTRKKVMSFSQQCTLGAIYNNNAYLSYDPWLTGAAEPNIVTIVCNLKKKTIIAKYNKCVISSFENNYATGPKVGDYYGGESYLYKLTDKGLKKVRRVAKYCTVMGIYDGKIYYLKYSSDPSEDNKARRNPKICVQKTTSSSEKTIVSLKNVNAAYSAGSKGCLIEKRASSELSYVFADYSTGELSKIS